MKILSLLAILLAANTFASAQTITTKLHPVTDVKAGFRNIVNADGGYLTFQISQNKKFGTLLSAPSAITFNITLVKYDSTMKVITVNNLEDGVTAYGPYEPMLKVMNDKFYLIYYDFQVAKELVVLNVVQINPQTLGISIPTELFSFKQTKTGMMRYAKENDANALRVIASPDKSKWLIQRSTYITHECSSAVIDNNMKLLFKKKIDLEDAFFTDACIDNNGTVYTAFRINGKNVKGHVYVQNATTEKDIPLGDDETYEIAVIASAKSNTVHVAGTCWGDKDVLSSVFSASIGINDLALKNYKVTEFPEAFLDLSAQHKLAFTRGKKNGFYPFWMGAFEMENGTVNLIGGLYRYKLGPSDSHGRADPEYIAGSLINVRFDGQGTPTFTRIPRDRVAETNTGQHFFAVPYHDKIIVLYNDNPANVDVPANGDPKSSNKVRNSVLMAAMVEPDGKLTKKIVADLSEDRFVTSPEYYIQLTDKSYKIPFSKLSKDDGYKEDYRWVTLTIE